jgi:asparagine N-glycosylation enzyme membrane subunit Stt3
MRTGSADQDGSSPNARPSTALVIAAVVAVLGASLAWNAGFAIAVVAGAYALLLIAVARAARDRLHGTAYATSALVVALISALLVPVTWGEPTPRLHRLATGSPGTPVTWTGAVAGAARLAVNAALSLLFALIWVVPT